MSEIVGYMLAWATYGTWLQGDRRGYVKKGKILPGKKGLEKANRKQQKSESVILTERERQIMYEVILTEAARIGHIVEELSVCTNPVHLVTRPYSESGRTGRIWTKGFDKRFCFSEEDFLRRIQYVQNHND